MQIPRWRNLLICRNSFYPSSHIASFHSTPTSLAKWKNKWESDVGKEPQEPQPSKNYIRYATRQKRADAKKALKDLLYKSGSTKIPFQDESPTWRSYESSNENIDEETDSGGPRKSRSKRASKSASRRSSHSARSNYRKPKTENFDDFDVNPEKIFRATFGNKCFTWSFRSWEDFGFQNSKSGFEWRDHNPHWSSDKKSRKKAWDTASGTDSDNDDTRVIGSYSERTVLGLPTTGTLKLEDVKSAFRVSALKWHPDKHQGPSQAMAEEKFKLCVDAYKSLCNALSSA